MVVRVDNVKENRFGRFIVELWVELLPEERSRITELSESQKVSFNGMLGDLAAWGLECQGAALAVKGVGDGA